MSVEVYLIDYEENIDFYNEIIELDTVGFMRTQSWYDGGLKELVTSITYDINTSFSLL